jgi:hypothetical protein
LESPSAIPISRVNLLDRSCESGLGAGAPASEDLSAEMPMRLQMPAPGVVPAATVAAGGAYVVDPAAQGPGLEMAWRGDDLVPASSGAGSLGLGLRR